MREEIDRVFVRSAAGIHRQATIALAGPSPQRTAELVCELYADAPPAQRAWLIERLLRPVGPLALAAIAGGAFAHLMYRLRPGAPSIPARDTARIGAAQVFELVRYVEQSSPDALQRVAWQIAVLAGG